MEIFVDSVKEIKSELLTIVGVCAAVARAITGAIGGDAAIAFIGGCLFKNPMGKMLSKDS